MCCRLLQPTGYKRFCKCRVCNKLILLLNQESSDLSHICTNYKYIYLSIYYFPFGFFQTCKLYLNFKVMSWMIICLSPYTKLTTPQLCIGSTRCLVRLIYQEKKKSPTKKSNKVKRVMIHNKQNTSKMRKKYIKRKVIRIPTNKKRINFGHKNCTESIDLLIYL